MDETDLKLTQLLFNNSRTPFRELADKLDISVQAVHKRVQHLFDIGAIVRYLVLPGQKIWSRVPVFVYGVTETDSLDKISEELGKNDNAMQVFVAGGNILYVNGLLHDLNELDDFIKFVEKVGMVNDIKIGILPHVDPYTGFTKKSPKSPPTLKPLDLRIIGSVYSNARKPVAEIAGELKVSTRRVKKHIEQMIEDNLVIFTIFWLPRTVGDLFSFMHVNFSKGIEKNVGMGNLMKKYSPKVVFCMPFTNQPQEVIAVTWSTSSLELEDLQRSVGAEDFVDSTRINMIYRANRFETWLDKKIFEEIEGLDKK